MLPFFFSLTRALCSRLKHGLLNGFNDRVRILASSHDQRQLVPKPLSRSGKIEVVPLDGKTISESHASSGWMTRVGPVASFQQHGMKHSELDHFPSNPVNFPPIT